MSVEEEETVGDFLVACSAGGSGRHAACSAVVSWWE